MHVCVALFASRSVAAFPREHREKHIGASNGEDRLCTLNTGLHVVSFGGMVTLVGRGKSLCIRHAVTLSQQVESRDERYLISALGAALLRAQCLADYFSALSA